MKSLFVCCALLCGFFGVLFGASASWADAESQSETRPESKLAATLSLGSGIVFEKNNDNVTESTRLPLAIGVGAKFSSWGARLEYASFRTADGNATISVQRAYETVLLWSAYEFSKIDGWSPYVALGLGVGRTQVDSRVGSAVESSSGPWGGLFAVASGFRAEWATWLAVRPELRYESAEFFKTKDARLGAFVQLDYIF